MASISNPCGRSFDLSAFMRNGDLFMKVKLFDRYDCEQDLDNAGWPITPVGILSSENLAGIKVVDKPGGCSDLGGKCEVRSCDDSAL